MTKVGIDFGSSYTRVASLNPDGQVEVALDSKSHEFSAFWPSVISWNDASEIQTGWTTNTSETLALKHLLNSARAERIEKGSKTWQRSELLAHFFSSLKIALEEKLGSLPEGVTFSIPDHFEMEKEFRETLESARFLRPVFISESQAAMNAFGKFKNKKGCLTILDSGGGFSKISIFESNGQNSNCLVAETMTLGGEDLDKRIAQKILEEASEDWGEDAREDKELSRSILIEAKKIKTALTHRGSVDIHFLDSKKKREFSRAFSRYEFMEWTRDLLDGLVPLWQGALKKAALSPEKIDEVLLAGGSSRIPYLQELAAKTFQKKPSSDLNVDQVVVLGTVL